MIDPPSDDILPPQTAEVEPILVTAEVVKAGTVLSEDFLHPAL
jgi:hypothetical protein